MLVVIREWALGCLLMVGCRPSVAPPPPVAPTPTRPPPRASAAVEEPPDLRGRPDLVVVSAGAVLKTLGGSTFQLPETTGPLTFVRVEQRGDRVVLGTDAESGGLCRPLPDWYGASDSLDLRLTVASADILPVLATTHTLESEDGSSIRLAIGAEIDDGAVGALEVTVDDLPADGRASSYRSIARDDASPPVGWLQVDGTLSVAGRSIATLEPFNTMLIPDGDGALGLAVYDVQDDGADTLVTLRAPCARVVARVPLASFHPLTPVGGLVGKFVPEVSPPPNALLEPSRLTWEDGSDAGYVLRPAPVARRSGSPCLFPNGRGPRPRLPTLCADASAFGRLL